jgi:hypothetical protein
VLRAALALVAVSVLALSLAACGDSSDPPASTADAPDNVISQSEADRHPAGSVERAFLEYWSALQYQSWAEVASYYDPAFRNFVGTAAIVGAKKINGSSYPQLKPEIARVLPHSGFLTLTYSLQFLDGTRELASTTWTKAGGSWQLVYDSRLDAELSQFAENRVEIAQNGVLPTDPTEVSPDATRAGAAAAQEQARFLQQAFDLEAP